MGSEAHSFTLLELEKEECLCMYSNGAAVVKSTLALCASLSSGLLPICYHSATSLFFVTAGVDSALTTGDFRGIHMYSASRDDDR